MKVSKKVKVITNFTLCLIVFVVAVVSFFPQNIVPISSAGLIEPIYNGNREHRRVSIMVNVYENTDIVNKMIDVLQEKGAKATFFVGGCWADDNSATLNRIVSSGNEIGNHGYFHKDHKKIGYEDNYQEIYLTSVITTALCGKETKLFAPPSGSFSKDTLAVCDKLGYKVIMWSKDTIDWRDKDENKVFSRATQNLSNGDLILMHPKAHTLNALGKILDFYKQAGFEIVPVSENIQ